MDDIWNKIIGKRIKVIFDDGLKPTPREGTLVGVSEGLLFLKDGDELEDIIPISRVIRSEVMGDG